MLSATKHLGPAREILSASEGSQECVQDDSSGGSLLKIILA